MASSFYPVPEAPADLKSRLAASYDLLAPKYNAWTQKHSETRVDWLAKLFTQLATLESKSSNAPIRILEVGAGAGLPTSKILLDYNNRTHVVVNDISPAQIQLARENLASYQDRVQYSDGDMMALSFEKGSLDVVVAMYSLIHLPRAEQSIMLAKIATWLRPGGLLLANFSEKEAVQIVSENWLGQEGAWVSWSGWGAEETSKIVDTVGFEALESGLVEDVVDVNFLWILAKKKA